ncbi:MAG: zinc-binding dehydrogenase [Planctomycetia bacterium]
MTSKIRRGRLWLCIAFEASLGLAALVGGWLLGLAPTATLHWSTAEFLVGLAATVPAVVLLGGLSYLPLRAIEEIRRVYDDVLPMLFAGASLWELALVAVAAGVGEELFFRGFLQAALADWIGVAPALLLASVIFGLFHPITPLNAAIVTLIGLYFGALWIWTGGLLAPIVVHAAYDFVALVYLLRVDLPARRSLPKTRDVGMTARNGSLGPSVATVGKEATMRAAYIENPGPPEAIRIGDLPLPVPRTGQVLVRVKAVALNPIDTYIRSGAVVMNLPKPFVVGCDLAGVVEAVGDGATRYKPGDRVWGSNQGLLGRQGTFAEFAAVDEHWLYPSPDDVSDESLAAAALVGITAHLGLFRSARLKKGDVVFVTGGGGGVGSSVIQAAKAVGARVVTTARTPEKIELCRRLGADLVVPSSADDLKAQVLAFAPGGVDIWWETLRAPDFDLAVGCLAKRGRLVVMAGRDARPEFPVGPFYVKDCTLHGFAMFNASPEEQAVCAAELSRWMAVGDFKPLVDRVLPLDQAAAAHRLQEDNTVGLKGILSGKIVLRP